MTVGASCGWSLVLLSPDLDILALGPGIYTQCAGALVAKEKEIYFWILCKGERNNRVETCVVENRI